MWDWTNERPFDNDGSGEILFTRDAGIEANGLPVTITITDLGMAEIKADRVARELRENL